jgi:hypothetical protein
VQRELLRALARAKAFFLLQFSCGRVAAHNHAASQQGVDFAPTGLDMICNADYKHLAPTARKAPVLKASLGMTDWEEYAQVTE